MRVVIIAVIFASNTALAEQTPVSAQAQSCLNNPPLPTDVTRQIECDRVLGQEFSDTENAEGKTKQNTPIQDLGCTAQHMEASRLYDHILNYSQNAISPLVRQADENDDFLHHRENLDLSDFNLAILAVEKVGYHLSVPNDYRSPYGEITVTVRQAPTIMARRGSLSAALRDGSASEESEFVPYFAMSRQSFVNTVVFANCRNSSPYFMRRHTIVDKGRDESDTSHIYPQGGLGKVLGMIGKALTE